MARRNGGVSEVQLESQLRDIPNLESGRCGFQLRRKNAGKSKEQTGDHEPLKFDAQLRTQIAIGRKSIIEE